MISYHHVREWQDSADAGERLGRLANSIAESFYGTEVDPDVYAELCTLALKIINGMPMYGWGADLQSGSVRDALRVGIAVLGVFDKSVMEVPEGYGPLFLKVEFLLDRVDKKKWESYWMAPMATIVAKNIGVLEPSLLKGFLGRSIDYEGVYHTGEHINFTKDAFEGVEHFNNYKTVVFGPGLQSVLRHCFPNGLAKADFEWESAEASLRELGSVCIALDEAEVKIPTLQVDVLIVLQALERMAHVLERYPDPDLQQQMAKGMKALINVTMSRPAANPLALSENFLRPHGSRRSWGNWMMKETLNPLLTLMESSISRWNDMAVHPDNLQMARDVRHQLVLESLMAYRSLIKSHTHKKYVHPTFQKIGPGLTASTELSGFEEFIYRIGYKELASLREKGTTSPLSQDAKMAMTDIFEEVEGFKHHVLLMFKDIRKPKFMEELGI
jgi:hypothetical protein